MAKKKAKANSHSDRRGAAPNTAQDSPASLAQKPQKSKDTEDPGGPPSLLICRNKHWRYISAYQGHWLSCPLDELESLAYINYNAPRPTPILPSMFFDILKIRTLIDDATSLAVRAASGTASSSVQTSSQRGTVVESLGLGPVKGGSAKLSRERRHRMREHATQKLAAAYRLDEVASSVAVMQGASALEDVAKHVLQRNEKDPDAQYVHFFHEKIPSMSIYHNTSLAPLDDVLRHMPTEASTYRTRAEAQMFKQNTEESIRECTDGLSAFRLYHSQHQKLSKEKVVPAKDTTRPDGDHKSSDRLEDENQPSSLELQLLFLRGDRYLSLACSNATWAFFYGDEKYEEDVREDPEAVVKSQQEAAKFREEVRKLVRPYAKRALRDFMSFLSHLEYTPGMKVAELKAFVKAQHPSYFGETKQARREKVIEICAQAGAGIFYNTHGKSHRDRQKDSPTPKLPQRSVYTLNTLFTAVPPADLPSYPPEATPEHENEDLSMPIFSEAVSYHPLLAEVVHSLLLCHCLMQTSTKELARHAYMAARIERICDGYPIFSPSRSPARADWVEILRRSKNWLQLSNTWQTLCTPNAHVDSPVVLNQTEYATLQEATDPQAQKEVTNHDGAMGTNQAIGEETRDPKLLAQGSEALQEEEGASKRKAGSGKSTGNHTSGPIDAYDGGASWKLPQRSSRDSPLGFVPDRAESIVRWIMHAPPPSAIDGPKRRSGAKARSKKKNKDTGLDEELSDLDLSDGGVSLGEQGLA
ncbi:hypothetical protein LTS17_005018 [Exophiala oligosperma]